MYCVCNTGLMSLTLKSLQIHSLEIPLDWPALAAAAEAVAHPSVSPPPETNAPAPSPASAAPGGAAPSPQPSVVAPGPGRPASADTPHLYHWPCAGLNTNATTHNEFQVRLGESLPDVPIAHNSVETHNFSDRNSSDMLVFGLSDHMSKIHICLPALALMLAPNWLSPEWARIFFHECVWGLFTNTSNIVHVWCIAADVCLPARCTCNCVRPGGLFVWSSQEGTAFGCSHWHTHGWLLGWECESWGFSLKPVVLITTTWWASAL